MRNRFYRYFWTELGRRAMGEGTEIPGGLPVKMKDVLKTGVPEPPEGSLALGSQLEPRKARYVYSHAWNTLRERGFSRPLRLEPWPGISLLVPFFKGSTGVLPQSFSGRIPFEERALSLVGRTAAARAVGISLWVALARWNDEVVDILVRGGVTGCSLDRLDTISPGFPGSSTG